MRYNKLVSVIMPVYNRENTIKRAIGSVLRQKYPELEIIVVDDGSTDHTVKNIRQYGDPRINLICRNHGGANKARNIGIRHAKGAYIAFQDSDDEWLPEKLDIQIRYMEEYGYPVCYCPYRLYENHSTCIVPSDYSDRTKYQEGLRQVLASHNAVSTQTLILKREVLSELGNTYFDEQMPRWQDYEFIIRTIQSSPVGYVDIPLVNVFRSDVSISTDNRALYQAAALLIKKHTTFLDIRRFLEEFISTYDPAADAGEHLINGLNLIQEALKEVGSDSAVNIKDMLITYMTRQKAIQDAVDRKECMFHMDHLQNRKFFIYGAGKAGQEVYQRLKSKGLYPKCFIVTRRGEQESVDGIPVIPLNEVHVKETIKKDTTVIIAISSKYQAELKENLMDRGYQSFFVYHGTV